MTNAVPELLAPAGTPSCALAAFDAGADAVYAGLARFNARERGENFDAETLGRVVDHAHKLGRKVYVTLNTLVKENELADLFSTLAEIDGIAPDGVLVQDLGVLRLAREYFPRLTLHGSTQMGFHNSAGLAVAETLGLKRVVLERQITLEELAAIRRSTRLELEVFIHGALCCSLSGSCLFSSYLGGSSGNRGKCKQPCRRRYYSEHGNGFFFSPQDLCSIELLPQLREIGVQSLKIEGRLRQPDYVLAVVGAYRSLLDAPAEEFQERLPAARELLSHALGRKWSTGFYTQSGMHDVIKADSIGGSGLRCGSVEALAPNGFGFTATRRIGLGDRLRVQPASGDDGVSLTLTKIFVANAPAKRAKPGERVFVCCDKSVPERGVVYKIGESFPDYSRRIQALPARKRAVNLKISVSAGDLSVEAVNTAAPVWHQAIDLAPARQHPLDAERLRAEFAQPDSPDWRLGTLQAEIAGSFFCPGSLLKEYRRNFWNALKAAIPPEGVLPDGSAAEALGRFYRDYQQSVPAAPASGHLTECTALTPGGAEPADRKAERANGIYELNRLSSQAILPEFCPENRLESLSRAIRSAWEQGIRTFRITSLYGFELMRRLTPEAKLIVMTPLPVCNSIAVQELKALGAVRAMAHIEMERSAIEELQKKSPLELELYRHGRPALLTTRATIPCNGFFRDGRGNRFEVRFDHRDGLTRIFPEAVHSVPRLPGFFDFYDLRNAHWKFLNANTFNFDTQWS